MSHFDYMGLRATLVEFLGEKEAKNLCGPQGLALEIFENADDYREAAYDDNGYFLLPDAGELFKELRMPEQKIRPGKHFKRLARKNCENIVLAAILKHGVSPEKVIGRAGWEEQTIAEKFMKSLSYFSTKTILPEKNIKDLFLDAMKAISLNSIQGNKRSREVSDTAKYLYINNLPLEGKLEGIGTLLDINATSTEVDSAIKQYLKNNTTEENGYTHVPNWIISNIVYDCAPQLWALKGYTFQQIFNAMEIRARERLSSSGCVTSEQQFQAGFSALKAYILAGFPEEWEKFSVKSFHFLGHNLIDDYAISRKSNDNSERFHFSLFAKSVINRYADSQDFNKRALQNLTPYFPDIYDLKYAIYDGSRSIAWIAAITSIEAEIKLLKEIHSLDIWHPLCNRVEFAKLSGEESSRRILDSFLNEGSKWRESLALEVIEQNNVEISQVIQSLTHKKQFKNLAKILSPTPEQFSLVPDKYKSSFLKVQLGI